MSGGSMWRSQVECPFYKRDDPTNIYCEGIAEDSCLITRFRFKVGRDQQMRISAASITKIARSTGC